MERRRRVETGIPVESATFTAADREFPAARTRDSFKEIVSFSAGYFIDSPTPLNAEEERVRGEFEERRVISRILH